MASADGYILVVHGPEDGEEATRVASYYERMGIRTRFAARDGDGDGRALADSRGIVVLVSPAALRAAAVREATDEAASLGKPIFPVRLANLSANGALPALPPESEWTDAFGPDAQGNIARLGDRLQTAVRQAHPSPFAAAPPSPFDAAPPPAVASAAPSPFDPAARAAFPPAAPPLPVPGAAPYYGPSASGGERKSRKGLWIGLGLGTVAVLGLAFHFLLVETEWYDPPIAYSASPSSSSVAGTTNGSEQLIGRWCDGMGGTSTFQSGGDWINVGQSGERRGRWQVLQPGRVNLYQGNQGRTFRYTTSGSSLNAVSTSDGTTLNFTRC